MKRLIFILVIILALAGLTASLWGNRLAGDILDEQLAPLLTRQLGLPVQLAPIDANLLALKAHSEKLVMGDPADPAVVATNLVVRLDWADLLTGSVRLVFASAEDLMVKPSRWPSSDSPAPDNYRFLDPWLPRTLQFATGRYVDESGDSYPVEAAKWRRKLGGGMQLQWSEQRQGGLVELETELASLMDLLDLADAQFSVSGAIDKVAQSAFTLSLHIQPGTGKNNNGDKATAYTLDATGHAIDTEFTTRATGSAPWSWPDASSNHITHLDIAALGKFLRLFDAPGTEETAETFLDSRVPPLRLIPHTGSLTVDETVFASEMARNSRLTFVADQKGLHIDSLSLEAPRSNMTGSINIENLPQGWDFSLQTTLQALKGDTIGQVFADTQWRWEEGSTQLQGRGATWGELLYSLQGHISAQGHYHGEVDTPVKIEAVLDSSPGQFALEHLEIALGAGRFHGTAALTGSDKRKLTLDLSGDQLNLNFLFAEDEEDVPPGVAIPEYLTMLPGLDLDWTVEVSDLHAPGLALASARARLERGEEQGLLVAQARGVSGGTLDITFKADFPHDKEDRYELETRFDKLDLPKMFEQPNILHSRTSGTLNFTGDGEGIPDVFANLRGTASFQVTVRPDNNWQRPALDAETLGLKGTGKFVIEGKDIVGISVENLDIDATQQDLTGDFSMVATRTPWLIADLKSAMLDVNELRKLLPDSSEEADDSNFLQSLRNLGAAQISLAVDSLTVGDAPVSQFDLTVVSDEDQFKIEKLAMSAHDNRLEGAGTISWQGTLAKIELNTQLTNVDLDQFLIRDPSLQHIPVDGTAQLSSEGKTVEALVGNLTGHIDLRSQETNKDSGQPSRQLLMTARRLENGVQADVEQLRLGDSNLSGSLRYIRSDPPQVDVDIQGGHFSLLPWESEHVAAEKPEEAKRRDEAPESRVRRVATASANVIGDVLTAPLRLFESSNDETKKDRLFSDEPLPLDALRAVNLNIKGQLDVLESTIVTLRQLSFDVQVKDGSLKGKARAGELNGGQADLDVTLDVSATPPSVAVKADFTDVRGFTNHDTYTRSGFASLTAQGQSTAALAGSLSGLGYVELGPGPFDYRNAALLSDSLAITVFRTLLPGSEQAVPQLECGITLADFKDGKGKTPYGYAIRTNQANLLGHLEVDLKNEQMQLNFESRSRGGVGLSMGNMISNSIQVRGSLTDPYIVPRATSLAWRGWAAFMTGGLSVVAESVLKRALASENPCPPIKRLISEEVCPKSEIAAASKLMCPQGQQAPN